MSGPELDITQLLSDINHGDPNTWEKLISKVYQELHQIAFFYMKKERPDHTLQATALVNELYMRLAKQKKVNWENRSHFFKAAAMAMNRILIDEARGKKALKRGGEAARAELDVDIMAGTQDRFLDSLEVLDRALKHFSADPFNQRKCQVVNLHFFSGLTFDETGEKLGVSGKTVKRDWAFAKAWLLREINKIKRDDGR